MVSKFDERMEQTEQQSIRLARQMTDPGAQSTLEPRTVTQLLGLLRAGNDLVEDDLVRRMYDSLRKIAGQLMSRERPGHMLQPTALVSEAYIALRPHLTSISGRDHFLRLARQTMRHLLVDEQRRRAAAKRSPRHDPAAYPTVVNFDDVTLEIAQYLEALGEIQMRLREVVEYRFLVGLTIEETARLLGVSHGTVEKDWKFAKHWLRQRMTT